MANSSLPSNSILIRRADLFDGLVAAARLGGDRETLYAIALMFGVAKQYKEAIKDFPVVMPAKDVKLLD